MKNHLRLHHELLLLALCDEKGTVAFSSMLGIGIGAALFTELLLAERIAIVHEGARRKKLYVEVRSREPLGEPVLDLALNRLADAKRRVSPPIAVSRLSGLPKLRHMVAHELCRAGVLRETEQQILLLFRRRVYPTVNARPEQALVRRIKAVLDGGKIPDERTAALIGIANLTETLAAIYTRTERRALKPRLKHIAESSIGTHAAAQAAAHAITAAQAAMTAATTAAVLAAT